jgi:integral membrane protein
VRAALVKTFQIAAITEAITWGGLLIGMVLKWITGTTDVGVRIFGPVHGLAFIFYLFSVGFVRPELRWTPRVTVIAIAASVPPFATWLFERWAMERARQLPPE